MSSPGLIRQGRSPDEGDRLRQQDPGPLFSATASTSQIAGHVAAQIHGKRCQRILEILRNRGPSTLFEVAAELNVFDHQISGRFTDLVRGGLIERTGERRPKPETGCPADIWRLTEKRA